MAEIPTTIREEEGMSFTVRVVNDDQEGMKGVRVKLEFTDLTRGLSTAEYTDSDGCADFSGYDDGEVEVYLDGSASGTYTYRDGDEVTITR